MEKFTQTNYNSEKAKLPQEAIEKFKDSFENIQPVISESDLYLLCEGNPNLEKLLESFLDYSLRYANDVWSMEKFVSEGGFDKDGGAEEFAQMDDFRTRLHNALVDSVQILSRNLAKENRDNSWVRELTSDGRNLDRVACGKLALTITYRRYIDNI
jgi:hypothetical protein